jgi:hypothetical protein
MDEKKSKIFVLQKLLYDVVVDHDDDSDDDDDDVHLKWILLNDGRQWKKKTMGMWTQKNNVWMHKWG